VVNFHDRPIDVYLYLYQALNDIFTRAFASCSQNPSQNLSRSDGKRPDGLTMIPWQRGQSLTWDVTVATTLADSYIQASASSAGAAAEMAASRKLAKYVSFLASYLVQPIALETLGPINESAVEFLILWATESRQSLPTTSRDNSLDRFAAFQCNFAA